MATTQPPDRAATPLVPWLQPAAVTAVACTAAGLIALPLVIAPVHQSPLNPAAGVALAAVLVYGRGALGGVALAAFIVGAVASWRDLGNASMMWFPIVQALSAALQAAVGALIVRRLVPAPLALTEPRDVARFYAAGAAASVVNATVLSLALVAARAMPASAALFTWFTFWLGDVGGLLIVTPIALTLIGRPRPEWAPRRLSVGLTLTLVTTFLAFAIVQVGRWDAERLALTFEDDASSSVLVLTSRLQMPLNALEALHGVFEVSRDVSRSEMRGATRSWLRSADLKAMGWSEHVKREELDAFEARARKNSGASYRVVDRADGAALFEPEPSGIDSPPSPLNLPTRGDAVAIQMIEPWRENSSALGVNMLSIDAVEGAIVAGSRSGRPTATTGFQLRSSKAAEGNTGVLVYQALYDGDPVTDDQRVASFRGAVFVAVSMESAIRGVAEQFPSYLKFCVVDIQSARRRVIAGAANCDHARPPLQFVRVIDFAGRPLELRVSTTPQNMPGALDRSAWVFAVVGLLSAAMLGASLLSVTGRTRRIESAVHQRTAALVTEVGERKGAEAALRDSEQRFRNILNNVPIGVVYSDLPGRVIQANPRFCELTGYTESELMSLTPLDYLHPDDVAEDAALTAQLVNGEIPMYRRDKRYLAKRGTTVWVRATVSLLRDSMAQPWRIVGVVEDITEHLRLEEAEHAREAAEASNRAKSEFLSRMSHELRTPLNAMLGFAQLLELDQRHPLAESQRPWVGQIQQAGWHLLEMINDVLDLSRIESGNLRLHTETLDLADLVASTLALVESEAARRRITITQNIASGTGGVLGDATRVKQILTNLLSNAIKYNSEPGRIHVVSRLSNPETVEISVTDTGLGMTTEQMAELFKPFNRLGRERSTMQGTGIGLVISQRLAELMGGEIRARSAPGQGSSFIVRLPRAMNPDTVRSALDAQAALSAPYNRRTVHYIEDNETNVEVMRGILMQRPQVDLRISVTGLDGLAAVRAQTPDLILLDMHLPDISGLELLRHFHADPSTSAIPIVVVSADALSHQIDTAMDAGAERYLTKPVNVAELLGVLDDLLARIDSGFR